MKLRAVMLLGLLGLTGCPSGTPPAQMGPFKCTLDVDCLESEHCGEDAVCTLGCSDGGPTSCTAEEVCTPRGRCVVAEEGTCFRDEECIDPPGGPATCSGNTVVKPMLLGACDMDTSKCVYSDDMSTVCMIGCEDGRCTIPPNPCIGVECLDVPPPACKDDMVLQTYEMAGTCRNEGGMAACDYQATETACAAGCENDECTRGTCSGIACATPPSPACIGGKVVTYDAMGTCMDMNMMPVCDYPSTEEECESLGGTCRESGGMAMCTGIKTQVGPLIITEYMPQPTLDPNASQWFEVHNPTGADVDIDGFKIRSGGPNDTVEEHVIASGGALLVPAGGYVVLANGADPFDNGTAPIYQYSGVALTFEDTIDLVNGADEIVDFVKWSNGAVVDGRSRSYDSGAMQTFAANDQESSWCPTLTGTYGQAMENYGTPGAANAACPADPCGSVACDMPPASTCNAMGNAFGPTNMSPMCMADGFGNPSCDYAVMETACPGATTLCVAGACEPLPANLPTAGQVMITEIMGNPTGADSLLEWVEIYNTTDTELSLFSLSLEDDEAGAEFTSSPILDPMAKIGPKSYVLLSPNTNMATNGGLTAYALSPDLLKNMGLGAAGTQMNLRLVTSTGALIDAAHYGAPTEGVAQQLSVTVYKDVMGAETSNDDMTNFCDATMPYDAMIGTGTPGAENEMCP